MKKAVFLTTSWNNWLTLGLGFPALIYAVFVLTTSVLSDFAGFLGMVLIGAAY
ncbi:hypothetical protein ACFL46_02040 [Candidatus Neomarinimicrobiota bacterium]